MKDNPVLHSVEESIIQHFILQEPDYQENVDLKVTKERKVIKVTKENKEIKDKRVKLDKKVKKEK